MIRLSMDAPPLRNLIDSLVLLNISATIRHRIANDFYVVGKWTGEKSSDIVAWRKTFGSLEL
jgi:hypothetical protein